MTNKTSSISFNRNMEVKMEDTVNASQLCKLPCLMMTLPISIGNFVAPENLVVSSKVFHSSNLVLSTHFKVM